MSAVNRAATQWVNAIGTANQHGTNAQGQAWNARANAIADRAVELFSSAKFWHEVGRVLAADKHGFDFSDQHKTRRRRRARA
jgi:hypothetical protein